MLKYLIIFLIGFSVTYGFNHKFTNPIDMPNTFVASQNEYYIQVDKDSLVVYKDDNAIYKKSFPNCTKIVKSELDSFRIKRYYDSDKIETILFYTKLELFDESDRNIAEVSISKEKISIISDKKVKEFEFREHHKDRLLENNIELSIEWSSYFGGSGDDELIKISKNRDGDLVVGGNTNSSAINGKHSIVQNIGRMDIMLMTLSPEGEIKWLTLIGSIKDDNLFGLTIDNDDNIWIAGLTSGTNFFKYKHLFASYAGGSSDAVVCKFNKEGNVLFSTQIGGKDTDILTDIVYNQINDRVYCTGRSSSINFPITTRYGVKSKSEISNYEAALVVFDNKALSLVFSSFLGPVDNEPDSNTLGDYIKIDRNGDIVVAGSTNSRSLPIAGFSGTGDFFFGMFDAFVAKFDSEGVLKWLRYVSGENNDYASCLAIDSTNNIILNIVTSSFLMTYKVGGHTLETNKIGKYTDNFLVKLDPDGELIWGGYFGGNGKDGNDTEGLSINRSDIIVTPAGQIAFTFFTASTDLKVDEKSIYDHYSRQFDIFLLVLDSNANYLSSTYLGGARNDTPSGLLFLNNKLYLIGYTTSIDFPIINRNSTKRDYSTEKTDGVIVCFRIDDNNSPEITDVKVAECSDRSEYKIYDGNQKPGFLPLNIFKKENCNISTTQEFNSEGKFTRLTVTVEKIDNSKNAYYKFEVINFANKSIIIEDSLLAGSENYVRFEPSDIFDFGEQSVYRGENCKNIMIYNDGPSDFTLNEAYFKDNINFSFPLSQLPLVVPAKSSREFTICSSPMNLSEYYIYDTLLIVNPCVNLFLPVSIVYNFPELDADSKCFIPIMVEGDIDKYFSSLSIVSNSNVVDLEINNAEEYDISIYNTLSSQINNMKITKSTNNIEIDFDNLANGMYFIYIHNAQQQKIVRLLLMR